LQSGEWHKFSVTQHGVYKITFDLLKKAGVDPSKIDPRNIRLFGNEGGMLPQLNSAPRPIDLTELAIYVKGEADGIFHKDDYILFYAEGPDDVSFDLTREIFYYERNLYDTKNYYFLNINDVPGKRIATNPNQDGSFPTISDFNDYIYHEVDQHNELKSGRDWYGEKFDLTTELTLKWNVGGIVENSSLKVVSDVMAQSSSGSTFNLYLNSQAIGDQYVLPIPGNQYSAKGFDKRDTLTVNTNLLSTGTPGLEFKYQFVKTGTGRSIGYLDFLLLSFKRKLELYNDQTLFRSSASAGNQFSTFEIKTAEAEFMIWKVTDPYQPELQEFSRMGDKAVFSTATSVVEEFVIFNSNALTPTYVSRVVNQNLHSLSTPNLLIVTHPTFLPEAGRLALHRQQKSGWSVHVVTTEQIFNEFSSGRQDVSAIRDFAKNLYDKSPGNMKGLLLIGRASFDYQDRLSNNTNFVPTYESRNSLLPLETYSSDDYFGFFEPNEGNWFESNPEHHTLEVGVGRLPVKSLSEARNVIDKIIDYETNSSSFGNWRKQIVFVADDGDANLHNSQAEQLGAFIESTHPEYDLKKIFLDAYPQVLQPAGEASPDATQGILKSLDKGALIVNYTGHGNEKLWAHERIFDELIIESLSNKNYPLFVTATCEFGRQDDPMQISSAELSLIQANSGAIGLVSTARPVSSSTNFELNKAFYNSLFEANENEPLTLGEIFKRTKNNSISGVSNRNFSLLGDPSLQLVMPRLLARVTEINAGGVQDTLSALSHVTVNGEILNSVGERYTEFSGTLQAVLYDKENEFTTLGNENPPFKFKQWHNALFRGKAKVLNGEFEFEFIVPKNIAYQLGNGKLSLYAFDENLSIDANGVELDFVVGKSEVNPSQDTNPPLVEIYLGDTTFRNGGLTVPDTRLIARLSDESGINLSGYGIGNNIIAILDDSETFTLNDYYESEINDFTRGRIDFPLKNLAPGRHNLTLKAWDTFNNQGEATISFIVSDGSEIVIESFGNYPNPFNLETTLFFTHNRSGDDLEAYLSIYDVAGKELKTKQFSITASQYQVDLLKINAENDFGENLKAGLYLARLVVRSLSNGSKSEQVTKLIITD
jgi:hypothetical protein